MRNARVAFRGVDLSETHPSRLHFCTSLPEVKQLPALVTIAQQFVHVPFTPHPMTPREFHARLVGVPRCLGTVDLTSSRNGQKELNVKVANGRHRHESLSAREKDQTDHNRRVDNRRNLHQCRRDPHRFLCFWQQVLGSSHHEMYLIETWEPRE